MEGYNFIRFLNIPLLQLIVAGSSHGVKGCLELSHVLPLFLMGLQTRDVISLQEVFFASQV
jgi:hypothetical protein